MHKKIMTKARHFSVSVGCERSMQTKKTAFRCLGTKQNERRLYKNNMQLFLYCVAFYFMNVL